MLTESEDCVGMFQYIICDRFKRNSLLLWLLQVGFNTLYVIGSNFDPREIVIIKKFQYIICDRFKNHFASQKDIESLFQYIICDRFNICSCVNSSCSSCFNTLYVIGSISSNSNILFVTPVSIHYM